MENYCLLREITQQDSVCNFTVDTDITSNKSTNVVKGERSESLENI